MNRTLVGTYGTAPFVPRLGNFDCPYTPHDWPISHYALDPHAVLNRLAWHSLYFKKANTMETIKHIIQYIRGYTRFKLDMTERVVVLHHGEITDILDNGERWVKYKDCKVQKFTLSVEPIAEKMYAVLRRAPQDLLDKHFQIVRTDTKHMALVELDGRIIRLVSAESERYLWKDAGPFTITYLPIEDVPRVDDTLAKRLIRAKISTRLQSIGVPEGSVGMLTVDGKAKGQLQPGTHVFWNEQHVVAAKIIDLRTQSYEVSGQEILTKDRVTLRVNLTANYRIVDPELVIQKVKDHLGSLHLSLQMAFRKTLGALTLDQLLGDKIAVDTEAAQQVRSEMAAIGIEVGEIALKDVILPGEMRDILNQVVAAQKEAEANVIRRREETNATRSLLNTAKVMADNPIMLRLKELEALESISSKVDRLTIHNGTEGLLSDLVKLRKE